MSVLNNIARRPSLAYYYAQKAVRSPSARKALGSTAAALFGAPAPVPAGAGAQSVARQLREDGLCFLPEELFPPSAVQAVREYLRGKPVTDQYDGVSRFDIDGPIPPRFTKLAYDAADLLGCQPLVDLANAPLVLDAVTEVLGTRPTIASFQAWWTLGENHQDGHVHADDVYHRDVDDLRFVKLFAYLTDTHERNGAHSFVRGSHRSDRFTRRGGISDEDVRAAFAPQDILTVKGGAGTAFLEDTWGIHRPLLATEGRRLIFSILYALTPWVPQSPGRPQRPLPAGLDPRVNRALFKV